MRKEMREITILEIGDYVAVSHPGYVDEFSGLRGTIVGFQGEQKIILIDGGLYESFDESTRRRLPFRGVYFIYSGSLRYLGPGED